MRFNQEDLRRGNVSFERMKEVVLQTLHKLDSSKSNPENLQRIGSKLLNDVEKIFLFKKSEGNDKESLDKFNYEFNLNNLMFFDKLIRANLELIKAERVIEHVRQQELQKVIQDQILDLKLQNEQKRLSDNEFQAKVAQLNSEMIQQMMKQRAESLSRIEDLLDHRNQLIESISERRKAIQASRIVHQEEALKYVDQVKVGSVDTFEGMTQQNKERFVNGYFALDEIRTRKLTEIDIEIKAEMEAMAKNGSDPKKSTGLVQNFQNKSSKSWARIEQLKQEKENVENQFKKNVVRLGDETGHEHINSSVSEEESTEHLEAFENQDNIKAEIDAHKAVTKEQTEQIVEAKREVVNLNNEILDEVKNFKKSDNEVIAALNDTQHSFNIDEINELSRQIDVLDSAIKDIRSEFSTVDILNEILNLPIAELDISDCDLSELDFDSLELSNLDFEDLDFSDPEITSKISDQSQEKSVHTSKI